MARLVALVVLELVLVIVLLLVVGSVVIPRAAPSLQVATPTSTPDAAH